MIRFIRNLILTVSILVAVFAVAAWFLAGYVNDRIEGPLFARFVTSFGATADDEYSFTAGIKFIPPGVEISNLAITAGELQIDGDTFSDAVLMVDKIECELWPLLRDNAVVISSYEGRSFEGRLLNTDLAERLVRESEGLSDLTITVYNGRCMLRGRFGRINVTPITVLGDWAVDDRGVATLVDRGYHNPDSPVPEGMIRIIEDQIDLDVRIDIFDNEIPAREVSFNSSGLWIRTGDEAD